jgi:hypothetical protein
MNQIMKFDAFFRAKSGVYIAIFISFVISFLFPTANSTQDGWGYAADAKWGIDLFAAHHLFYTAHLYLASKILPFYDILLLGKHLNALYVAGALFFFNRILVLYKNDIIKANLITFFVGSTFAVLRFGTENETYIIPIFYSLIGSYFFVKFDTNRRLYFLFFSGLFLSFACLFHQIQVFWWLLCLVFLLFEFKNYGFKQILVIGLPALIVPFVYVLVLVFYRNESLNLESLIHFVFETFYTGSSKVLFDFNGFIRFLVAIARCFLQIHSTVYLFCQQFKLLYMLVFLLLGLIIFSSWKFLFSLVSIQVTFSRHYRLFLVLLLVQLAFALFSYGNSEMLVSIPFFVGFLLILKFDFSKSYLLFLSISILVWNLIFGLFFNKNMVLSSNEYWAIKAQLNPKAIFYLRNGVESNSIQYYSTGIYKSNCRFPKCVNFDNSKKEIDSLLNSNVEVYTNFIEGAVVKNSASIMYDEDCKLFFGNYLANQIDSVLILGRYERLYKIKIK